MRRLIPHPGLSLLLVIFWLLMANSISIGGLAAGIVIALALPVFTSPFWPGRPKVRFGPAIAYLGLVIFDIVVANFQIAAIILFRRSKDLRPAWLVIPMDLATPEAITVFAGTISLTPGTVSSDVSACGRFLLVHALDAGDPPAEIARIKARYEARLKKVFP